MTSSNSENVNVEKKSFDVLKEISERNPTIDKGKTNFFVRLDFRLLLVNFLKSLNFIIDNG